jgi:hypothetical protein
LVELTKDEETALLSPLRASFHIWVTFVAQKDVPKSC